MSPFICPICSGALVLREKSLRCETGHCFDVARQGYVNLLRGKTAKDHGDDRRMVEARSAFLSGGHYDLLADEVAQIAVQNYSGKGLLLDAGCGEGFYTCRAAKALTEHGCAPSVVGVDISREAVLAAARRKGGISLAVASVAALPLADASCELVLNIFSPQADAEFLRVLRVGGRLLSVFPLEDHLMGLKRAVYENPYENPPPRYLPEGFRLKEERQVRSTLKLERAEDVQNLFLMTPYYYKTSRADQEKLSRLQALETPISFGIYLYEKE